MTTSSEGTGVTKLLLGPSNDIIVLLVGMSPLELIDGGEGIDTVDYSISIDPYVGIAANLSTGTVVINFIFKSLAILKNIENLVGTKYADRLTGDANANVLAGNAGNDVLVGLAGNDTLNGGTDNDKLDGGTEQDVLFGGAGADKLSGGDGNDTIFQIVEIGMIDTIDGGLGTDTVDYSASTAESVGIVANLSNGTVITNGIPNQLATLSNIENLVGTGFADYLTGDTKANVLTGGAGNDVLTGGEGADTLLGDDGDDTIFQLVAATLSDVIKGGLGVDTVNYSASTNPNVGIDADLSRGEVVRRNDTKRDYNADKLDSIENVVGTSGADRLTGDANANVLTGGAGNDSLNGGAGNDVLIGGIGNDTLLGGDGDDMIFQLVGASGIDNIQGGLGVDTVDYSASTNENVGVVAILFSRIVFKNDSSGTTSVGRLEGIENVAGTSFADVLAGDYNANVLIGGAGNDVLFGLAGNDRLQGGTGNDLYQFSRGDGQDTVVDTDVTLGNTDQIEFTSGLNADQLWFSRMGNDLNIAIIGSIDAIRIQNWYLGADNQVEKLTFADGGTLLCRNVETLVQAMVTFAVPVAGQTKLPLDYQTALAPVIALAWG